MAQYEKAMIEFYNVGKRYGRSGEALKDLTFTLKFGEMAFLTGHSGAGKTTLLKLIAGIESPSTGEVFVADQNVGHLSRRGIASLRRSIGMVFQDTQLLEYRTIFENVALPLVLAGYPHRDIAPRVRDALDTVGILDKEKRFPNALSVGEQQRAGIARAIANRPPLLLADEPTGNVDAELGLDIIKLFAKLNKSGITVLVATHDLSLIASLRHRILTLKKGILNT